MTGWSRHTRTTGAPARFQRERAFGKPSDRDRRISSQQQAESAPALGGDDTVITADDHFPLPLLTLASGCRSRCLIARKYFKLPRNIA